MITYKVVLDERRAKADGRYPIMFRITFNRNTSNYSTGIAVKKEHWNYRAKGYHIIPNEHSDFETVIGFTNYYPHHFESSYAAYLIPSDIQVDEVVWIEDVIEDIIGGRWNQGDTYRLQCCEAIWNGKELELLYSSLDDRYTAIG